MVALGDLLKKVRESPLCQLHTCVMKEHSILGHIMASSPSPSQRTWSSKPAAKVYSVKGAQRERGTHQVKAELRPKSHDDAVVQKRVMIMVIVPTPSPSPSLLQMDGEHVQGSPHDFDMRPNYNTVCTSQQVISCSGGPLDICSGDNRDHVLTKVVMRREPYVVV